MLLVVRWLDAARPDDGALSVSIPDAAAELGLADDRASVLEVMGALGRLEERGVVDVAWPGGPGGDARITLAPDVRRDARRLFGA